ncbi:MAG TPA: hypothetical protein VI521_01010 [Candidatus Babeliales bacterium]|nr:hypothetical protein [Candidatus Babeliales bacterium]
MYYKKSFIVLITVSIFWAPMVHPGKNGKKEKISPSLKKSDFVTFTAYTRLIACRDALKQAIDNKRLYLNDYPKVSTHTSIHLCNLLSTIFKNQADYLQARQEAESQRELMLTEKNEASFQLLVNALSKCNDTLLYEHSENRHHASDASLTRGSTASNLQKPQIRQSTSLSMLSSGAINESAVSDAAHSEPLGKAHRSFTAQELTRNTPQESLYARTPSFSSGLEQNETKSNDGKTPTQIPE